MDTLPPPYLVTFPLTVHVLRCLLLVGVVSIVAAVLKSHIISTCSHISHDLTRSHPISHPHTSTLYLDLWISGVSRSLLYNNLNSVGDPSMSIQTAATTMNDTMSFWHLEPSRWSEPEIYFTAASFNHHNYRAILIHSSSNKCNSLKAKEKVSH